MRNVIVTAQGLDTYGVHVQFTEVFWITVNSAPQPLPGFTSAVPAQASAQSTKWQADGATTTEITALQLGTVREFVAVIMIPLPMFTDAGAAQVVDAYYRYFYAKVNGGAGTIPATVLPSSVVYTGAAAVNETTTVAAASNGALLPQTTINVASTTGFSTAGTIFVPTNQTTGPQSGQIVVQPVTYTGLTGTTFTGCSGGTGTMFTGAVVNEQSFTAGSA